MDLHASILRVFMLKSCPLCLLDLDDEELGDVGGLHLNLAHFELQSL